MAGDRELDMEYLIRLRRLECNVGSLYNFSKRTIDIFTSVLILLLLSPLLLVVVLLIKLTSRGKVLYVQDRNGIHGKIFKMYKFRSMVMNADKLIADLEKKNEAQGPMFKIKDDPRVTKIGRFIRKTSIDELPQLINIIKGDMTLVGPRPPLPREVAKYEAWQKLRLSVKPGLTGLWQISGRSNVGFEEMVRMDLRYIRERSLFYDIKILIKTIPVIFGSKDAF
ncbi:MAG: sugar transferase [Acetivibrionales bacterium]|jgi:exopolysaccharide biosynthesis polyprenyl glycosylphosphotransferase